MPIELIHLNTEELKSLKRDETLFLFPVGTLEDHGPHLPIGTAVLKAEAISDELIKNMERALPNWNVVLGPAVPMGIDSNTSNTTFCVRAHVLRDWLVDVCTGLKKEGFKYFACISGSFGPKQLTAIEEAGKILKYKSGFGLFWKGFLVSLSSSIIKEQNWKNSLFYPNPDEHGGETDTSIALKYFPQDVNASYKNLIPITKENSSLSILKKRLSHTLYGFWGTPAKANGSAGEQLISKWANSLTIQLKEQIEGKYNPSRFRTWYSIIPVNRSFFKAGLLACIILILLCFLTFLWV